MGSYSYLVFGDYSLFDNKNGYYGEIVDAIFLPEDYIEVERISESRNQMAWGDQFLGDKGHYLFKGFRQKVKVCKSRLEIYGRSLKSVKSRFAAVKKFAKSEGLYHFPLSGITFEKYLEEIKSIIRSGDKHWDNLFLEFRESLISNDLYFHGMSTLDYLYCLLICLDGSELVEYDLTYILDGGYVDTNEVLDITIEKIIVLTEGKTDSEFISSSLKLLYPEIHHYYHFIDFSDQDFKLEGSASALVKLIKAFAAANIHHPIIAIFDNDTTGKMELSKIAINKLPPNIRALSLPNIALGKKYPTIGPFGMKKMNINGLACGIELYLGSDVLSENNNYIPVLWKAYVDGAKSYQGEIQQKHLVQKRFVDKMKSETITNMDEMDMVIKTIMNAFNN